jgi:hypothetical protein
MGRPALELADIFRLHGPAYREAYRGMINSMQRRVMRAIETCRTAVLGGHVEKCDRCGHRRIHYNSCGNRHCNKCQSLARARWLEKNRALLLPVPYFHLVFTVPAALSCLALQNQRVVYGILFRAAAQTLRRIAADPKHLGARLGFLAVLHTWGQNLQPHPHLHIVVPGGGLSIDGRRWIRGRAHFFLSVRVLSRLFRGLFLHALQQAQAAGKLRFHGALEKLADADAFAQLIKTCRKVEWVVYAKPPFGGPQQVLDYLGRYTHRVAISNNRLISLDNGRVTFRWKDYRAGNKQKRMALDADEFIRRFLLHVLPRGFVRIRHYGWLANAQRRQNLALCRELLGVKQPGEEQEACAENSEDAGKGLTAAAFMICPACGQGRMVVIEIMDPRASLGELVPAIDSS